MNSYLYTHSFCVLLAVVTVTGVYAVPVSSCLGLGAGKLQETANDRFCEKLRFLSRVQYPPAVQSTLDVFTVHMYSGQWSRGLTGEYMCGQLPTTGGRCGDMRHL